MSRPLKGEGRIFVEKRGKFPSGKEVEMM